MILRSSELTPLQALLRQFPVVAIIGPWHVGKATLARQMAKQTSGNVTIFDLENPTDIARLTDPMLALQNLDGLVIIEEIQRRPELFPVLRVLAERRRSRTKFLLLGSASPYLLKQSSDSLAGRIAYHELNGFGLHEVGQKNLNLLWLRGRFPRSYLSRTNTESLQWRRAFVRTFLERDLLNLALRSKHPRCIVFGQWWQIIMVRFGFRQNLLGHLEFRIPPSVGILIS
jgi:predicted AAA+ superfamily ATPase